MLEYYRGYQVFHVSFNPHLVLAKKFSSLNTKKKKKKNQFPILEVSLFVSSISLIE